MESRWSRVRLLPLVLLVMVDFGHAQALSLSNPVANRV